LFARLPEVVRAVDRSESLADRVASGQDRVATSGTVGGAAEDRAAAYEERGRARDDRESARLDRTVASQERLRLTKDGLTGVYLRGEGSDELVREVARAGRTGEPLSVSFVDVDGLKSTNDRLGHAAGDRLLVEVARTLRSRLRPYDLIIRYGGDEFVCVLSGCPAVEAQERMADVNRALGESDEHGSVTIGIAQLQDGETADSVVARADQALYEARRHVRGNRE
jgi:diguanylate cyclase (GGDEF)-like protein